MSFDVDLADFSAGAALSAIIIGIIRLIVKRYEHKNIAVFDTAISKVYFVIQDFVESANKMKDNVNALPINLMQKRDQEKLDELLTFPQFDLTNKSMMIEMFFKQADRQIIKDILDSAINFESQIHKIMNARLDDVQICNEYDKARTKFNKEYYSAMNSFISLVHSELLGKWQV